MKKIGLLNPRLKINRQGCTRLVILIWGWAIKVPQYTSWRMFLNGLLGNLQEREFSSMKLPELAPVLFSIPGGWLNVMPRAEVVDLESPGEERFQMMDIWYQSTLGTGREELLRDIVESKVDSFGVINGRVVAIDYG